MSHIEFISANVAGEACIYEMNEANNYYLLQRPSQFEEGDRMARELPEKKIKQQLAPYLP